MFRLTLNPRPLQLRLEALEENLTHLEVLLARVAPLIARAIERNFDEEGRPVRWPPLTPATLRRKPAGLKILQLTGRLRRSIETQVEGNAIIVSTNVPYAAAHQFGIFRRRLPARPFLVLTREDLDDVAQELANSLETTGRRPAPTEPVGRSRGSLVAGRLP